MEHLSISCWQTRFQEGKFQSSAVYAQCLAGWYDWFCRDDHLYVVYSVDPSGVGHWVKSLMVTMMVTASLLPILLLN